MCVMLSRARTVLFMKRSAVVLSGALLMASGCATGGDETVRNPGRVQVRIVADTAFGAFTPREVSVEVGSTVSFVNDTVFPHNVIYADDSAADSGLFVNGEMFDSTFDTPGVFTYVCSLHPGMAGTVTVTRPAGI